MFEQHLLEDVIPTVEKTYRTAAGRENRAIVGLSMGGGQALTIGLSHLDLFSHVGAFSSGLGASAIFRKTYAPGRAARGGEQETASPLGWLRQRGWRVRRLEELFGVPHRQSDRAHLPGNDRRAHVDGVASISERNFAAAISVVHIPRARATCR